MSIPNNKWREPHLHHRCEGFLCVYSQSSFDALRHVCDHIFTLKELMFPSKDDIKAITYTIPMVLVGNKCDLKLECKVTMVLPGGAD
jgi:GTPase SAR1 family protein